MDMNGRLRGERGGQKVRPEKMDRNGRFRGEREKGRK
jgi:hypothetical protein